MTRICLAAAALLSVLSPIASFAKCPLTEYTINGRVTDAEGRPLHGARIVASWSERAVGQVSNERDSDADGAFAIRIPFDTFSGRTLLGEARCEGILERVTLTITRAGYRPLVEALNPAEVPPSIAIVLEPE